MDFKPKGKQPNRFPKKAINILAFCLIGYLCLSNFIWSNARGLRDSFGRYSTGSKGGYYSHSITNVRSSNPDSNVIKEKSKFIFPLIQEAPILNALGLDKLFKIETISEGGSTRKKYSYSADYFENLEAANEIKANSKDSISDLEKAAKNFKLNGHRVYAGNENPQIVIVTGIDFINIDPVTLVKIIQNRVDYAHLHSFALYSRWIQEFTPLFEEHRSDANKWSRLFIMREAMQAFPNARWFWYLDESTLIARNDLKIDSYILKKESLDPILLKNQPIVLPDGAVKTYDNIKAEDVSLIITQTGAGLNTDSFILKNDLYGRALIEFWMDPLFRKYPAFRKDESAALSHILQWHPLLLSKTGIVPGRTIASISDDSISIDIEGSKFIQDMDRSNVIYSQGDLVVNFKECLERSTCAPWISKFVDSQ